MMSIAAAYQEVNARIADAARRAGRDPQAVTLVAVTKTRTVEEVEQVIAAGAADLGENYVQEMVARHETLAGHGDLRWHAIGHLQRNKVRFITPFCALIHSVDSARLADEIDRRSGQHGRRQPVLVEVNVAQEASKMGVPPDEVESLAQHVASLDNLRLQGLMAMTPYGVGPEDSRRHFARLRELAGALSPALPQGAMETLSMGMTQDYETAVEEGATLVRVGTAIFGPRSDT